MSRLGLLGISVMACSALGACRTLPACPANGGDGGAVTGHIAVGATPTPGGVSMERVSIIGNGTRVVGTIAIDRDFGTVQAEGRTASAYRYEVSAAPNSSETTYQTLLVSTDRVWLVWFYCAGGRLTRLYAEGTDGVTPGMEGATGTCNVTTGTGPSLTLPAISMDYPPLVDGLRINGTDISYDGIHPGRILVAGRDDALLPFAKVDCSNCGNPGWQELHALVWDPSWPQLCIGIFYFFDAGRVDLPGLFCLPNLFDPTGGNTSYDAAWEQCQ